MYYVVTSVWIEYQDGSSQEVELDRYARRNRGRRKSDEKIVPMYENGEWLSETWRTHYEGWVSKPCVRVVKYVYVV